MIVQKGCLKCHGFQGYQVGDVRGGVGVAVPMQPYLDEAAATIRQKTTTFGAIWLVGVAGLGILFMIGRRRLIERAAADALSRQQHEAIEKANAELTQFANISAHHLMEPSRRLLSFAQRLRAGLADKIEDEDARASLGFIEQGATRMRDLVRDIERYLAASTPRGPLRQNDPAPAIAEVQKHLAGMIAASGARIEIQALCPVCLDMPRLVDLFEVLLGNALIHANPAVAPLVRIDGQRQEARVRLRIEDNGPGIPEEYRQRVFGVFERLAANPQAGTGIGLAIARRIVDSRGGRIWIETSPLGGAAIVCELSDEI
jgi:light-regulated signal transduction histidine kinase (bacteriophytochrome)